MGISFIAFDRIAERRAAADPAYRRQLKRNGKTLLSQSRLLTDSELLAKLHSFGIELDRPSYLEQCQFALSAEEMSELAITPEVRLRFKDRFGADWVWFALTVLWERWFPGLANYEQLDDRMQLGYSLAEADAAAACEHWFLAWDDFLSLFARGSFKSLEDFDADFRGTQRVFNWVQDFENTLLNASGNDPRWHRRRIEFCEQFLQRFYVEGDLTTENMRRSMAESTFGAGRPRDGDALFQRWLKADPQWGWGWIGWSDCYGVFATEQNRDPQRAEQLLKQALDVPGVRDRTDMLDRLSELYEEQGRHEEARSIQEKLASAATVEPVGEHQRLIRTKLDFDEEGLPLDKLPGLAAQLRRQHEKVLEPLLNAPLPWPKVGRNDPCPCGSGKKFKKCCGR